jgi:hypothetical protein
MDVFRLDEKLALDSESYWCAMYEAFQNLSRIMIKR